MLWNKILKKNRKIRSEVEDMKCSMTSEIAVVREKLAQMWYSYWDALWEEIQQIQQQNVWDQQDTEEDVVKKTEVLVQNRMKRRNIIVIYGVPEQVKNEYLNL